MGGGTQREEQRGRSTEGEQDTEACVWAASSLLPSSEHVSLALPAFTLLMPSGASALRGLLLSPPTLALTLSGGLCGPLLLSTHTSAQFASRRCVDKARIFVYFSFFLCLFFSCGSKPQTLPPFPSGPHGHCDTQQTCQ